MQNAKNMNNRERERRGRNADRSFGDMQTSACWPCLLAFDRPPIATVLLDLGPKLGPHRFATCSGGPVALPGIGAPESGQGSPVELIAPHLLFRTPLAT